MSTLLQLEAVSKHFGGLEALSDVTLDVRDNEVLALVGDKGAGKSTLMKAFADAHPPTHGQVLFNGERVDLHRPPDARAVGSRCQRHDMGLPYLLKQHILI